MVELTERQAAILGFLRSKRERGYGASVREICEEFEIVSPNGVMAHLKALRNKGLVTWEARTARSIKVIGDREPIAQAFDAMLDCLLWLEKCGVMVGERPLVNFEGYQRAVQLGQACRKAGLV